MATIGLVNSSNLLSKPRVSPVEYDDWVLLGQARASGPSVPSYSNIDSTGIYGWVFVDGKELHFDSMQMPHRYKEGTAVPFHIHWAPTTTETYTGTWTLDYFDWVTPTSGTAKGTKQTITSAISGSKTAFQMQYGDFSASMSGTNRTVSSIAFFRLSLSLSAGTGLILCGLDAHYQVDAMGSRQASSKD